MAEENPEIRRRFMGVYKRIMPRVESLAAAMKTRLTLPDLSNLDDYTLMHTTSPFGVPLGEENYILIHKSTKFTKQVKLKMGGDHNLIVIGANVELGAASLNCMGTYGAIVIGDGGNFKTIRVATKHRKTAAIIGAKLSWVGGSILVGEADNYVLVGDNCLFSWEIDIVPSDSHPIYDRKTGDRINYPAPIVINESVWIGKGVTVGKGVELAKGTVIGQLSLVTKSTEPYCIYAGVPAKLIKRDVEWRWSLRNGNHIEVTPDDATPPPVERDPQME